MGISRHQLPDVTRRRPLSPTLFECAFAAASILGLAVALSCSGETPGQLRYIEDDQIRIEDPGGPHSAATGIGCGNTEGEALTAARSTANYNLRTILGAGRYKVAFEVLREVQGNSPHCVEVEARVVR